MACSTDLHGRVARRLIRFEERYISIALGAVDPSCFPATGSELETVPKMWTHFSRPRTSRRTEGGRCPLGQEVRQEDLAMSAGRMVRVSDETVSEFRLNGELGCRSVCNANRGSLMSTTVRSRVASAVSITSACVCQIVHFSRFEGSVFRSALVTGAGSCSQRKRNGDAIPAFGGTRNVWRKRRRGGKYLRQP